MNKDNINEFASFDEYLRQGEPSQKESAENWKTAIGLQAVDGLQPSAYLIDVIHAKFLIQFLPHASMAYLMMKLFSTLCLTNSLAANSGTFSIHFWSWKPRMEKRIPLR